MVNRNRYWILILCTLLALSVLVAPLQAAAPVIETFEGIETSWAVQRDGSVTRSNDPAGSATYSALARTAGSGATAQVRATFSSPAASRIWEERPGVWNWQRAQVYVPSATVNALTGNQYLRLAGLWASSNPTQYGWYLHLTAGNKLRVSGSDSNGNRAEFDVYGSLPLDQWFTLEIGLHSQNGPGVKRAFAFLVNGQFYGWYRQGRLTDETYDRAAMGILTTNSSAALTVYVDNWRQMTTGSRPDGPDNRSTATLQEQDFRNQSGVQVQYDWSTWANTPTLHPVFGLYTPVDRLQAGRNIDRMPSVADGWGEIEIDWPNGTPPDCPSTACAAMIGFRKEINREENLEIYPTAGSNGQYWLILDAWTGQGIELARWSLPEAAAAPGNHMPEPGDIIRARWQQVDSSHINVRASYFDASENGHAGAWYTDIINHTFTATNVPDYNDGTNASGVVNFLDGYHTASSITIDSSAYSIRRYRVGTLATYGSPPPPSVGLSPQRNYFTTNAPLLTWTRVSWATGYRLQVDDSQTFATPIYSSRLLPATALSLVVNPPQPLQDGLYYWRVQAQRADGSGNWSVIDSFVVDTT